MQLMIQFPDFSNTAALDKYIERRLRTIHRRLESRYEQSSLTLRGSVLGRKADGKPKSFEAEILIQLPKRKSFVARKRSADFRTALNDAADAMEKILRRESEKTERSRKTVGKTLYPVRKVKETGRLPKAARP